MRTLTFLLFVFCLQASAQTSQPVFLHVPGLSEKNLASFQQSSDAWQGVHYVGYCHDLEVAQFIVDRRIVPFDTTLTNLLRTIGFDRCLVKLPPSNNQLQQVCSRFEPRH